MILDVGGKPVTAHNCALAIKPHAVIPIPLHTINVKHLLQFPAISISVPDRPNQGRGKANVLGRWSTFAKIDAVCRDVIDAEEATARVPRKLTLARVNSAVVVSPNPTQRGRRRNTNATRLVIRIALCGTCLLYTSDAADE